MVQRRKVQAVLAIGAAAAVGGGSLAAAAPSGPAASAAKARVVSLKASPTAFRFNRGSVTVRHGLVTFRMFNPSTTHHGIAVEGRRVDKDGRIVGKGRTSVLTVRLAKGTYTFYCPVPGHRAAGMKGKVHVT